MLGEALQGPPRRVRRGHQVRDGHAGRERRGPRRARIASLRPPRGRGQPAPAADRPHRPLPAARARPGDPDRGDARRADRARPRGQGALHRLLELRRLAGGGRRVDLRDQGTRAVRVGAEPLLAARPRRRARGGPGVRAVRARRAAVLPAGVRPAHRQVPPRRGRPHRLARRPRRRAAPAGWRRPTGTASRPWRRTPPSASLSILDVAIAGLAAQPAVTSVISGATRGEQVRTNASALRWQPTDEDLDVLDRDV